MADPMDLAAILANIPDISDDLGDDAPNLDAILAEQDDIDALIYTSNNNQNSNQNNTANNNNNNQKQQDLVDSSAASLSAILSNMSDADATIQLDIDRAVQSSLDAVDSFTLADEYASGSISSSATPRRIDSTAHHHANSSAAAIDNEALTKLLADVSAIPDSLASPRRRSRTPPPPAVVVVVEPPTPVAPQQIDDAVNIFASSADPTVPSLNEPSAAASSSAPSSPANAVATSSTATNRAARRTRRLTTPAQDIARGLADTAAVVEVASMGGVHELSQQHGMPTAFAAHQGALVLATGRGTLLLADVVEADNSANVAPLAPAAVDAALANGSFGKRPESPTLQRRAILPAPVAADAATKADSVTAVDVSNDDDGVWIVAGHKHGAVRLWHNDKVVKTMMLHNGEAIARVAFLGIDHDRFLSLDIKGVMLLHIVRSRLLGGIAVESPVVLDGSAGVVEALSVLRVPPFVSADGDENLTPGAHALLDGGGLCSFATARRVHIISLAPSPADRLRYSGIKRPLGIPDKATACLAWREIRWDDTGAAGATSLNATDPQLAVAWGAQVQFLRIISKVEFVNTGIWNNLPERSTTCGLVWLGTQAVAVVDELDRVTIVDPYELCALQRLPMSEWKLVFNSRLSGDHVSFQQSLLTHNDALLALCVGEVRRARLLTWRERIAPFVADGNLHAALELAKAFHDGTAPVPSGAMTREATSEVAAALLRRYAARVFGELSASPSAADTQQMKQLAMVCISCSIELDRTQDLLGEMLAEFEQRGYGATYLEQLEPYVLANELRSLSPIVIRQFVAHYASTANRTLLRRVEQCLLHLDLGSIDFQQVALLCRRYQLFAALIYLNTRALKDYITPLDEMLNWLAAQLPTDASARVSPDAFADAQVALAKLLAFVECTLKGRAYPRGVVDAADLPRIWQSMYQRLFAQQAPAVSSARGADDALLALAPELRERARAALKQDYAGLRALMYFGAKDALRVLSLFMDARVARDAGVARAIDVDECLAALATVCLQFDVDPFEQESRGSARAPFTPKKLAPLFDLISEQVMAGRVDLSDRRLLRHLLFYLLRTRDEQTAQHRQSTLLMLLPQLPADAMSEDRMLSLAEQAEFHTICELLYSKRRDWKNVIKSRLCSKDRGAVFTLISHLLDDKSLSQRERQTVQSTTVSCLKRLVEVDINATSRLLTTWFASQHDAILEQLQPHPDLQYMYLKALLQGSSGGGGGGGDDNTGATSSSLPANLVEDFIELMCQQEPSAVKQFLEANNNYRIDAALRVCEKHKVIDGIVYLLERMGNITRALTLLTDQLKQAIANVEHYYEERQKSSANGTLSPRTKSGSVLPGGSSKLAEPVKRLHACCDSAIQLCVRNGKRLDEKELAAAWLRVLGAFFVPLRRAKARRGPDASAVVPERLKPTVPSDGSTVATSVRSRRDQLAARLEDTDAGAALVTTLTACIDDVLASLTQNVDLPTILIKIVEVHGADELGDFRTIIDCMLSDYTYETTIMRVTNRLLGHDISAATHRRVQHANEAFSAGGVGSHGALRCAACGKGVVRTGASVVLFRCGHVFDRTCAKGARGCILCKRRKRGAPAGAAATSGTSLQTNVKAAEATAAALAVGDTAAASAAAAEAQAAASASKPDADEQQVPAYAATNEEYEARLADFVAREKNRFEMVKALSGGL
jgi:hypothetical protein